MTAGSQRASLTDRGTLSVFEGSQVHTRGKTEGFSSSLTSCADHSHRFRRVWRASCWWPRWPISCCSAISPSSSPFSFGALLAVALAFLLNNLLAARERGECCQRQTAAAESRRPAGWRPRCKNAAAINARLNQSELRYKGLVDAQGDAIFRRDASSRLTYGNDAFFKLFGLDPARAIGYPFAPEPHPESRAPLFGSFAAWNRAGPRPL